MSKSRFTNLEFDDGKGRTSASEEAGAGKTGDQQTVRTGTEIRDAQYYMEKAEQYEMAGFHEHSLKAYASALGENPLLLDAWIGQLMMLLELEEYPEVRLWADKALEKFPDNPSLLAAKAAAIYRMGLHSEASDYCDAAVKAKGDWDIVWLCRGELMLEGSQYAADACFKKALDFSDKKDLIHIRTGAIYLRYKKYSKALISLQHATSKVPNAAWAWYLLGTAQDNLGDFKQAQTSFQQAAELNPRNDIFRNAAHARKQTISDMIIGFMRRLFSK